MPWLSRNNKQAGFAQPDDSETTAASQRVVAFLGNSAAEVDEEPSRGDVSGREFRRAARARAVSQQQAWTPIRTKARQRGL